MTDRKLLQQALDALEFPHDSEWSNKAKAIEALQHALAQPEQEPVKHAVIAGVLFDFMGWLTSRQIRLVLSASDDASPAVKVIEEFAKMRGLSLDDAKVKDWQDALAQPEQNKPLRLSPMYEYGHIHDAPQPKQDSISTNDHLCAMLRQVHDVLACTALPMKREWVGLTQEERHAYTQSPFTEENYRAIEAALRSKNNAV